MSTTLIFKKFFKSELQKSTICMARCAKKSNNITLCYSKRYKKKSPIPLQIINDEMNALELGKINYTNLNESLINKKKDCVSSWIKIFNCSIIKSYQWYPSLVENFKKLLQRPQNDNWFLLASYCFQKII